MISKYSNWSTRDHGSLTSCLLSEPACKTRNYTVQTVLSTDFEACLHLYLILFVNQTFKQHRRHVQIMALSAGTFQILWIPSSVYFALLTMITNCNADVLLTLQGCVLVVSMSKELKVSTQFNISLDLPLSFFPLPALLKIPFSIHESRGKGESLVRHSCYQSDHSFLLPPHN